MSGARLEGHRQRASLPRMTWPHRATGTGCPGNWAVGCAGAQAVHRPPREGKGSPGGFPSSLWACHLNHSAIDDFGGHTGGSYCCHFLSLHPSSSGWKGWGIFFSTTPCKVGTMPWSPGEPWAFQHLRGPNHAHLLSLATAQLPEP